jgi:CRP/FNR family transcriptional regulator, anaerobic regulatory protein
MTAAERRALLLQCFPTLAELAPAHMERLLSGSALRHAPDGTVLFLPKQRCEGFPLVLRGSVRVTKTSPNGREIVLYRVEPGEGCIMSGSCLLGAADYAATAIAEGEVALLAVPASVFQELILASAPFRTLVFGMYGRRLAEIMELVEEIAFRKLDARLANLLAHRGPVIAETHQKLADELGSVREVVSRTLRSFEQRGWIRLERERVTVLDPNALVTLATTTA